MLTHQHENVFISVTKHVHTKTHPCSKAVLRKLYKKHDVKETVHVAWKQTNKQTCSSHKEVQQLLLLTHATYFRRQIHFHSSFQFCFQCVNHSLEFQLSHSLTTDYTVQ